MNTRSIYLKVTLAALLIFVTVLAGCSSFGKDKPDPNNEPKPDPVQSMKTVSDYFPHTVGSSWQYLGEGNEYASFTSNVLYAKGNRSQISKANGGTVSSIVFDITDNEITNVFFQGEDYDGTDFLDEQPNQNTVILKGPLEVGTKWEDSDATREIIDINATVDTPAGKFEKCIKVKINSLNSDSIMYDYYKDGVGLVKTEFISGDTIVSSTLEKFDIK